MDAIPIIRKSANLEIFTKIVNSVAAKYDCRVDYIAVENRLSFHGDKECCRHITAEALALFSNNEITVERFLCPIDRERAD